MIEEEHTLKHELLYQPDFNAAATRNLGFKQKRAP